MNNREMTHPRAAVFFILIKVPANERFVIYIVVDNIADLEITPIARHIFSTANDFIGQGIRDIDEPDVVWLLFGSIPDLGSDVVNGSPPPTAFLPKRKDGVELHHILASPLHLVGKVLVT